MDLSSPYLAATHTHITDANWHSCPSLRRQFALSLGAQDEEWLWRVHSSDAQWMPRTHLDISREGTRLPRGCAVLRSVTCPTAEETQTDALQMLPEPSNCK